MGLRLTSMIIDKKAYVISLDNDLSNIEQSWLDQGFDLEAFEATTPDTIPPNGPLVFGDKVRDQKRGLDNPIVSFTDAEKAIWYSHYNLWHLCQYVDRPIIIIEDDTVLTSEFPSSWNVTSLKYFVRSSTTDRKTDRREFVWAGGYVVTPVGAERLIRLAEKQPIDINVDGFFRYSRDKHPEAWCTQYATNIDKAVKAEHKYD